MPRGGARPGAGRPRNYNPQPTFKNIIKNTDIEAEALKGEAEVAAPPTKPPSQKSESTWFSTVKTKGADLPPPTKRPPDVVAVSNERAELGKAQIRMLLQSPHVSNVTRKTVSYTAAFKEMFWRRYCEGEPPEAIFADSGIDPDILGQTRVWGMVKTLRSLAYSGKPITEGRQPAPSELSNDGPSPPKPPHSRRSSEPPLGFVTVSDIRKLYHQVAYLTQEMEFLKKIMLLGKDGKSK